MYIIKNKQGYTRYVSSSSAVANGYYEYTKTHEDGYAELWDNDKLIKTSEKERG